MPPSHKASRFEYRLTWESIDPFWAGAFQGRYEHLWDEGDWDTLPWTAPVSRVAGEDGGIHDQHRALKQWAESHEQPIRNVRLERRELLVDDEGWEPVDGCRTAVGDRSRSRTRLVTTQAESVLVDVADERQRQDEKWGPCSRPPLEWLGIIAEEFGEVAEKVVKGWVPPESDFDAAGYRLELIQLAACAVSAVENLDYGTAGLGRTYSEAADAA
jgi:hypothetical protein